MDEHIEFRKKPTTIKWPRCTGRLTERQRQAGRHAEIERQKQQVRFTAHV